MPKNSFGYLKKPRLISKKVIYSSERKTTNINKLAFSLVEISIVFVILGILISGIVQGIDLYVDYRIVNAKNLTTNSRVGRIEDLEIWLETTSKVSFATGTTTYTNLYNDPIEGTKIGMWRDINPKLTSENRLNIFRNTDLNNQPTYTKKGINSIPALKFDSTDSLNTYGFVPRLNTEKFTTFLVMNHDNLGGNDLNFVLFSRPGSIAGYSLLVQKLSGIQSLNYMVGGSGWGGSSAIIKSSETPLIITFLFDGISCKLYRNGVEYSQNLTGSYVLNTSAQTYLAPRGYLGEFIYYSRNINDRERIDIEQYLSKKWSINIK